MADDCIYTLGDKIHISNVDSLLSSISPLILDSACSRIILDMINVRTCDSQGIRLLLNLHRKANENGKELILYRPDQILKETIEYVKLSHVFSIRDSL